MARCVLADDDPRAISALALLMQSRLGLDETAVSSDWPGLCRQAEQEAPELILLDWELPGSENATTSLAEIRRSAPGVRIIALSARPEAAEAALRAGVDAFLAKSDPPEQVIAVIQHCLPGCNQSIGV